MTNREPLAVQISVVEPETGETLNNRITHFPDEGEDKLRRFSLMLDWASEQALMDLEEQYERDNEFPRRSIDDYTPSWAGDSNE